MRNNKQLKADAYKEGKVHSPITEKTYLKQGMPAAHVESMEQLGKAQYGKGHGRTVSYVITSNNICKQG